MISNGTIASWMMPDWLRQRAYLSPDTLALITHTERWTFRELERQAVQLARRLFSILRQQDSAGARIALLMRSSAQNVALIHAISLLGGTLVPLNIRLTPAEIAYQIQDSQATLLIYDATTAATAHLAVEQVNAHNANVSSPSLHSERGSGGEVNSRLRSLSLEELDVLPEIDTALVEYHAAEAVFSIIYTSGTTGRPKGAMLTYGNFWNSSIASALNLGLHTEDRWLASLPLFHVGGLSLLLKSVIYGMTIILHEAFDPATINHAIDEDGVTIISAISVMLQRMLDQRGDKPYPASLRCVLLGGGPAPQVLLERCAARNIPVAQTYGLTEACSQVATLTPGDALRKLGSAGKPLMLTEIHIEQDGTILPPHTVGEIVVRGPTVTLGYYNKPEATAKAIQSGWLHTGDLGYLDTEGYLYIVDRRDDLIISGGENVYPAEVEAVLLAHPAVEEAGVVGIPDERWGQVPLAAIKVRAGMHLTAEDLRTFCLERLARYKVPARFHFEESLPRNASGKLLRRQLSQQSALPKPQK